jgi:WD40 repeat protein
MPNDLQKSIVRILDDRGHTRGTGFLVSDKGLIATCAHVVQYAGAGPRKTVNVSFSTERKRREAQVVPEWWKDPYAEDVAILRLSGSLPKESRPLPLGSSAGTSGHTFKTFGFPEVGQIEGVWGYGTIGDHATEAGHPLLQLTGTTEVTVGFSGGPVLNTVTQRVVGMVNSITPPDRYDRLSETAFITPTEILRDICPDLELSNICPYKGLAAFTEEDAEFFFGREKLIAELIAKLNSSPRFLAIVGPSGSGKSSVVQAGLFPALRRGDIFGSEDWHLLSIRPGTDPFASLSAAGLSADDELKTALQTFLDDHPDVEHLVLFLDQFEELFALCDEPLQKRFLNDLVDLLESGVKTTVILTLRADFYDHLLRCHFEECLKIGQINVSSMDKEELQVAIHEPVRMVGLSFESGLVDIIVEEVSQFKHPLPLLEAALTQVWKQRSEGMLTHKSYQRVGQVTGAISQWAEDIYSALDERESALTQRVFTRLIRYGEEEIPDTRQRRSLEELLIHPDEEKSVHGLVRQLADARLLVTNRDPSTDEETIEIIHDALIWEWGRLRQWITQQREFLLWRQRLDERLRDWQANDQDEGALLRGAQLVEAERWLSERTDRLNLLERRFIQESIALREREQEAQKKLERRIIIGLTTGLIIALFLALLACVLAGLTGVQWQRAEREADERATAQAIAENQRQIALARSLEAQAWLELDNPTSDGLTRSALLAIESMNRFPSLESNQALRQSLNLLPTPILRLERESALAFSPDGQWIILGETNGRVRILELTTGQEVVSVAQGERVTEVACSSDRRRVASADQNGVVRIWEVDSTREIAQVTHRGSLSAMVFSPDGNLLATAGENGGIIVWDVSGQEIIEITQEGAVSAIAFDPTGQLIATGNSDGIAYVWNTRTGQRVSWAEHHELTVESIAFSPDGQWLISGGRDGEAKIWNVITGQQIGQIEIHYEVYITAFSPDGQLVVVGGGDPFSQSGEVQVWDPVTENELLHVTFKNIVFSAAFSPDGRRLVTGRRDGTVQVWEIATRMELARAQHGSLVRDVVFDPNGGIIASAGIDGTVKVWEAMAEEEVFNLGPDNSITDGSRYLVIISRDGQRAIEANYDGTVSVWEIASEEETTRVETGRRLMDIATGLNGQRLVLGGLNGLVQVWDVIREEEIARAVHTGRITEVNLSADNQLVASGDANGMILVWQAENGTRINQFLNTSKVNTLAFDSMGQRIVSGYEDGTVSVWAIGTGALVAQTSHNDEISAVIFSSDGQRVASASLDGTVKIWNANTGQEITHIEHNNQVLALAFSPDDELIASGSGHLLNPGNPGSIWVWDSDTGQVLSRVEHESRVETIVFSSDGHWIASGSDDGVVKVWETTTGQQVAWTMHQEGVQAVSFGPGGRTIISGSDDGVVRAWLWQADDLITEACSRLSRNLTIEEWQYYIGSETYRPTCPNLPIPETTISNEK